MVKIKSNSLALGNVLYVLLIIGCMLPGYLLVPYGMYYGDEPYQIMNTMDIYRCPMAPLTSRLGGILGDITDFRWISFRYLAVTINYLAIIVSGLYMYRRVKSFKIAAVATSAAIFLSGLSRDYHNIFGWDCWTALFTAVLTICVSELVRRPDFRRLFATCAIAAVTIAFRMPNMAVVIPAGWIILLFATTRRVGRGKNMPRSYPWLYVLFTGIFFIMILCSLYGSLGSYMESLRSNMLSEHSAYSLLMVILFDIVRYAFAILAFAMLVRILDEVRSDRWGIEYPALRKPIIRKYIIICVSVCAIVLLSLMMFFNPKMVSVKWYDVDWVWLALCFAIWQYFRRGDSAGMIASATVLLIGCTCFIGSNNGFVKYPGYIMIPFVTALLLPLCGIRKMKYYMLIAGVPLVAMDCLTMWERSFMDVGLSHADTCVSYGRARGLYSTADAVNIVETIEKVKETADPESERIVIGEGFGRFVYEYLLDCPDSYLRHDWTNSPVLDSPAYVEWLQSRIESEDNPMIVYVHRAGNSPTKMKEFLDRNMRLSEEYGNFSVYVTIKK